MSTPTSSPGSVVGDGRQRLVQRLRAALVPVLTLGNWNQIEVDHRKVGLAWRSELEPGWGKPKYVERVLNELPDEEVIAVARRSMERFADRDLLALENELLWLDAGGIARVSEVTRLAIATVLDHRRLHPSGSPCELLDKFARTRGGQRFEYTTEGEIVEIEVDLFALLGTGKHRSPMVTRSTHLALLDSYGFREWPDARLFQFIEFLVYPTVRQGDEQSALVNALNTALIADQFELIATEQLSGYTVFKVRPAAKGVAGRPKNLIFASIGPKPEIGFADAVNNDVVILKHAEHCLVYDEPFDDTGLRWTTLVAWWAAREGLDATQASTRKSLADRLMASLDSEPERRLFMTYFRTFRSRLNDTLPALVPQVYLHYDPVSLRELRARGDQRRFAAQRMDFLLLLPHSVRIVIEIDGQQHYSTGADASARPSPEEYARTVRADRQLRLAGYEVYRFGGYELRDDNMCAGVIEEFFTRLFVRHKLLLKLP